MVNHKQINIAITGMDNVTQQNAALVEEAAAAASSLQDQAQELSKLVNVFKLHDSGSATVRGMAVASNHAIKAKPARNDVGRGPLRLSA